MHNTKELLQTRKNFEFLFDILQQHIPQLGHSQYVIQQMQEFHSKFEKITDKEGQLFLDFSTENLISLSKDDWNAFEQHLITLYRNDSWQKPPQLIYIDDKEFDEKINQFCIEQADMLFSDKNPDFLIITDINIRALLKMALNKSQTHMVFTQEKLTNYKLIKILIKGISELIIIQHLTKEKREKILDYLDIIYKTKQFDKNLPLVHRNEILNSILNYGVISYTLDNNPKYHTKTNDKMYDFFSGCLNKLLFNYAATLVDKLIQSKLLIADSGWDAIHKTTTIVLKWSCNEFYGIDKTELPRIRKSYKNVFYNAIDRTLFDGAKLAMKKYRPIVKQKYYIRGFPTEKTLNCTKKLFNQKYTLNDTVFGNYLISLCCLFFDKITNISDKLKILSLFYKKEITPELLDVYTIDETIKIRVLADLYDINLEKYSKEKDLFIPLMEHLLSFDNLTNNLRGIDNNFNSYIKSYKYEFILQLNQLRIMNCFLFFQYDYFFDSRGRMYPRSSITHYYPRIRGLISFYDTLCLSTPRFAQEKNYFLICAELKKQLSHYLANYQQLTLESTIFDMLALQKTWKFGEAFYVFALLQDYLKFSQSKQLGSKYIFKSFYSFDSSFSGGQFYAEIFQDKRLAENVSLIDDRLDLYLQSLNFINTLLNNLINFDILDINEKEFSDLCIELGLNAIITSNGENNTASPDIQQYLDFISQIKEFSNYLPLEKQCVKYVIMTIIYSSTSFGRTDKIKEYFIMRSFKENEPLSVKQKEILPKFSSNIEKLLAAFVRKQYPILFAFPEALKKATKNGSFDDHWIRTPYFDWHIKPFKVNTTRISINDFHYTFKENTNEKDFAKLNRSFPANFIQSIDAALAFKFSHKMQNAAYTGISHNIIHDRFFTNPLYCLNLKTTLKDCYLEIFDMGYVFSTPEIESIKSKTLKKKDLAKLIHTNFVKF